MGLYPGRNSVLSLENPETEITYQLRHYASQGHALPGFDIELHNCNGHHENERHQARITSRLSIYDADN